jgi:hypothetical protein
VPQTAAPHAAPTQCSSRCHGYTSIFAGTNRVVKVLRTLHSTANKPAYWSLSHEGHNVRLLSSMVYTTSTFYGAEGQISEPEHDCPYHMTLSPMIIILISSFFSQHAPVKRSPHLLPSAMRIRDVSRIPILRQHGAACDRKRRCGFYLMYNAPVFKRLPTAWSG